MESYVIVTHIESYVIRTIGHSVRDKFFLNFF